MSKNLNQFLESIEKNEKLEEAEKSKNKIFIRKTENGDDYIDIEAPKDSYAGRSIRGTFRVINGELGIEIDEGKELFLSKEDLQKIMNVIEPQIGIVRYQKG